MAIERRRVFYRGRVQGVGFRYTAHRIASRYSVVGFVRNLDDGRVELLAEGEHRVLDELLDAIQQAMGDKIHEISHGTEGPGQPEFHNFSIQV